MLCNRADEQKIITDLEDDFTFSLELLPGSLLPIIKMSSKSVSAIRFCKLVFALFITTLVEDRLQCFISKLRIFCPSKDRIRPPTEHWLRNLLVRGSWINGL